MKHYAVCENKCLVETYSASEIDKKIAQGGGSSGVNDTTFGNVKGEDGVNFESGIEQILKPRLYGKSTQPTTNGYQLFDASKLPTKSQNGVTFTNNGDGSFTISGNGNLIPEFKIEYIYSNAETKKLLKAGAIRINGVSNIEPSFMFGLVSSTSDNYLPNKRLDKNTNSFVITTEDLETCRLRLCVIGFNTQNINGTIKPMVYQDGDGTFEPFTGGQPSPNPNYPQPIISKEVTIVQCCGKNLLDDRDKSLSETKPQLFVAGTYYVRRFYKANANKDVNSRLLIWFDNKWNTVEDDSTMDNGNIITFGKMGWGAEKQKIIFKKDYRIKIPVSGLRKDGTELAISVGGYLENFEEYQGTTITLSKPITLRGIQSEDGNITIDGKKYISDVICEKDGVIGVKRNVILKTFNETQTVNIMNVQNGKALFNFEGVSLDIDNYSKNYLCKHTISNSANANSDIVGSYVFANTFRIRMPKEVNTIELFKTWITKNNINVVYKTNKPTFEPLPLTDQQAFKTLVAQKGNANLFANAFIDLNYVSTPNYVFPYDMKQANDIPLASSTIRGGIKVGTSGNLEIGVDEQLKVVPTIKTINVPNSAIANENFDNLIESYIKMKVIGKHVVSGSFQFMQSAKKSVTISSTTGFDLGTYTSTIPTTLDGVFNYVDCICKAQDKYIKGILVKDNRTIKLIPDKDITLIQGNMLTIVSSTWQSLGTIQ